MVWLVISAFPKAGQMQSNTNKTGLTGKKILDSRFEENIFYWSSEIQHAYKHSSSL